MSGHRPCLGPAGKLAKLSDGKLGLKSRASEICRFLFRGGGVGDFPGLLPVDDELQAQFLMPPLSVSFHLRVVALFGTFLDCTLKLLRLPIF